jgi:VRR-NUC domain.
MSRHLESRLQQNCVRWFRTQYPKLSLLLFAIPNGGARSKIEAGIMKGEGVVAGVADLFLSAANVRYHGFYIEMKIGKGKQTDKQEAFQLRVEKAGYRYEVCRNFEQFIDIINDYFSQAPNN